VLACYGMNDGIYLPLDDARMKAYQDGITRLKQAFESRKPARFTSKIVFITPPLHNADKPSDDPNRYDTVLDAQALWLLSKRAEGWNIVDIRPNLKKAVSEAKRANPAFVYAADGVHPGDEGHRFIADAVCQQLWVILMLPGSPQIAGGFDAGEALFEAAEGEGEAVVVDAELVEHGGVEVADVVGVAGDVPGRSRRFRRARCRV
jgi:hypothetical protein